MAILNRLHRLVCGAIFLTGICSPDHTQGMENKGVSCCQFAWIGDDLIGVINCGMQRDTPRLMPDDALAVFARGLRIVAVTVEDG